MLKTGAVFRSLLAHAGVVRTQAGEQRGGQDCQVWDDPVRPARKSCYGATCAVLLRNDVRRIFILCDITHVPCGWFVNVTLAPLSLYLFWKRGT